MRLAIEMATHEQAEREALEGELKELEARWREAEEIARIADNLCSSPRASTASSPTSVRASNPTPPDASLDRMRACPGMKGHPIVRRGSYTMRRHLLPRSNDLDRNEAMSEKRLIVVGRPCAHRTARGRGAHQGRSLGRPPTAIDKQAVQAGTLEWRSDPARRWRRPLGLGDEPWKIGATEARYLPMQTRPGDYALSFREHRTVAIS